MPLGYLAEEVIKKGDSFRRGNGLIVDIPGDQQCVRPLRVQNGQNLTEKDVFLLLQEGALLKPLPQVQVR